MLDIYEMHIFLTVAETGSFSEAGRRLQMSQPAVSMQIRSLEKRLNIELFHRSGRHIRLTETAQALIPMARTLVNHSIEVEETLAALEGEVIGQLKLACSTTAGKYILPRLIAGFIDRYPSVQVTCNVGSRGSALKMLLADESQLAITSLREISKELEYRHFVEDPIVLIVAPDHPWAKQGHISINELLDAPFILREYNSGTTQTLIHTLAEHDINIRDLRVVMTLGNSEAIHMAVRERIGVAFISRCAAQEGLAARNVIAVEVENLQMSQQLYMVRRRDATSCTSAPSAFWDYVYSPGNRDLLTTTPGNRTVQPITEGLEK